MLNFKSYFISLVLISFIFETLLALENNECNKLVIEGGEQALRKLFSDFNEIKSTIQDLKTQLEDYHGRNETKNKDLPFYDVRIDEMPQTCNKTCLPKDCATAKRNGIYNIQIEPHSNESFYVVCDAETENGGWLVIQKRQDGSEDFHRDWVDYEKGFGDIEGEFFIGLKKLYALTNLNGAQELLIVMEDANTNKSFAKYDAFAIGNETESYKLKRLGRYSGTAGNSLQYHVGMKFSTRDRDNDVYSGNCALAYTGAWWHRDCHHSNLNGKYGDNAHGKGINWKSFLGYTQSNSYVKMMIRRSRNI